MGLRDWAMAKLGRNNPTDEDRTAAGGTVTGLAVEMTVIPNGHPTTPGNTTTDDTQPSPPPPPPTHTSRELRADLLEHHVNMIAFSGCVGIGLFLQSGKVIFLVGPGLAPFVYLIAGAIIWCAVASLGEMAALFPARGSLFVFSRRYLDAGVGYAAGWMVWFAAVVVVASEVLAIAHLFQFRFEEEYLHEVRYPETDLGWGFREANTAGIWPISFLAIMFFANCLPVRWFGRLEYIFGVAKMIFIVGLIFFNVVINIQKQFLHPPYGRTWTFNEPYSFTSKNITLRGDPNNGTVVVGPAGVLLAFWSAIYSVIFSMIGFESVSITAPENKELERTEAIKMGTRKIALRIILLYTLSTIVVAFNVPYTDKNLRDLTIHSIPSGSHSAFILAAVRNQITWWPSFFNGFFIFSATSAGINWLYISSRVLHALAVTDDAWPNFAHGIRNRLRQTFLGVPINSVIVSCLFGFLGFLSTGKGPEKALGRMAINSAVSMLIVYAVICLSYLEFFKVMERASQGHTEDMQVLADQNNEAFNRSHGTYPYQSWGQTLKARLGLVACSFLAVFNGWRSFVTPFSRNDFVASYISSFIFALITIAYHVSLDGWDPREWKRHTSYDLQTPPPVVVDIARERSDPGDRVRIGRLGQVDIENVISRRNAATLKTFVWDWLK